jgi:UDP-N-acetylglucosamine 2-epimerase (hydrolysing)
LKKKIVFITGTRADFGKIKNVIDELINHKFDVKVFVTGMHLDIKYGFTFNEIKKKFPYKYLHKFKNYNKNETQDIVLAKTIQGFSNYLRKIKPDLVVVHGDRVEALAGAISSSLNNILTLHIEGGELSGTIDEHLRHSISKLSHLHAVSNMLAKKRLIHKLGESSSSIFVCGSPDIDIMRLNNLPNINLVKKRYNINFLNYSILIFHPVTTEINKIKTSTKKLITACMKSKKKFVIIYPNNDPGNLKIIDFYKKKLLDKSFSQNFKLIKSMRFEYFLSLLKNCDLIIGNSSAGIREAPFYGIPTINLGTRQLNRVKKVKSIHNIDFNVKKISSKIKLLCGLRYSKNYIFGKGDSSKKILKIIKSNKLWKTSIQKKFNDE